METRRGRRYPGRHIGDDILIARYPEGDGAVVENRFPVLRLHPVDRVEAVPRIGVLVVHPVGGIVYLYVCEASERRGGIGIEKTPRCRYLVPQLEPFRQAGPPRCVKIEVVPVRVRHDVVVVEPPQGHLVARSKIRLYLVQHGHAVVPVGHAQRAASVFVAFGAVAEKFALERHRKDLRVGLEHGGEPAALVRSAERP